MNGFVPSVVVASIATAVAPKTSEHRASTVAPAVFSGRCDFKDTGSAQNYYRRNLRGLQDNWSGMNTMVGARGFEPRTPCAQGRCATRLRYAPTLCTKVVLHD